MLEQRMRWLMDKGFNLVPLSIAAENARSAPASRLPLTTAITFDDGWYSTASELVPVLGKLGIPSTLYLCTAHYLEGWAIPAVATRYLIWKSGLQSVHLSGLGAGIDGEVDLRTPALRHQAAVHIVDAINRAPASRQHKHAMLEQLAVNLQLPSAALDLASRRFEYMNAQELLEVTRHGCEIEMHGHVHSYPVGNTVAFEADLRRCKEAIMATGLPEPTHYCYPSGNFDAAASPVLARLGVRTGTTCMPGLIRRADATQSHYLPRFLDGENITMLEFEAEMSGFSELIRRLTISSWPSVLERRRVTQQGLAVPAQSVPSSTTCSAVLNAFE